MRLAFQEWGLPLEVQTDNADIFVLQSDPQFPAWFTLWLVALGMIHLTSRPHRPTDQGSIERNHRTLGDFSWQDLTLDQVSQLQPALDLHRSRYNQEYPSQAAHCAGLPPLIAFPHARSTGHYYHPACEWDLFRLELVDAYLAQRVWTRPVMDNGLVKLGNWHYYIGYLFKHQKVSNRFLPTSRSFAFQTSDGTTIKELPALGLEKEEILGFLPADRFLPVPFQLPLP